MLEACLQADEDSHRYMRCEADQMRKTSKAVFIVFVQNISIQFIIHNCGHSLQTIRLKHKK